MRQKASRPGLAVRDDPTVVALVTRAAGGDPAAWEEIVERYAPLVWSICARFQLSNHDHEDVGQKVRLLLVEQLGKLRERAALPGWIATTTHRERLPKCRRLLAILTSDPPCSYAEISEKLQIPMGSIGPQRACCLERLRKYGALSGLGEADLHWAGGEHCA